VWIGEYTVSGFGAVLLDMSVTVDGTLFAGAMSSGAAQMDVTVGIITVSELQIAIDGLNVATILDFLSGNVYVGGATLEADGSSPPVATPDGAATAADLDTTACTTAAVDCTVEVSISTISLGTGLSVAAGENVLVLAGLGVFAGLDLNTAGYLSADFLNTMTVQLTTDTPGASVELVSISIREPATLWLSVIALFGLAIGKSHRRRIRQFGGQ
jgi:hypothetical protein